MSAGSGTAAPIALCHEWTTSFGGAEQVSRRIVDVLGIDDVFTFTATPGVAREVFPGRRVQVSPLGRSALAQRHWQWFLPLMPRAWRGLDLNRYRTVITNSYACTNAIRVPDSSYHISYCQTPIRYAWEWRREIRRFPTPVRPVWPVAASALRRADRRWAQRVTLFIANSYNVAGRIRRYYGRESVVIYPSIDTEYWTPGIEEREDFFLVAGRLVPYKRPDIAVEAANRAGVRLVVAGAGPELEDLQRRAGPTVEFVRSPSREELRSLYRRATAFLFPGIEDFGITLVEAQACGTPVIAFAAGGAKETVRDGETGLLYRDPSADALARVLKGFDPTRFAPTAFREQVRRFDLSIFDAEIRTTVATVTDESVRVAASDDFAQRLQQDLDVQRE